MNRIISFIIALVAVATGTTAFGQSSTDTTKIATIKVSGITCNGDMDQIKKKLVNSEGIDEATFTEAKSGVVTFTVKYHTSIITEKKIREKVEAAPSCDNPKLFPYKAKSITPEPTKPQ
jgi:copper chaperone CopZ